MNLSTFLTSLSIAIPLLHVLGILMAIRAILTARTSQGAIAWAFSLAVLPYFSIPLYLIFGRSRFYGYVEARRAGDQRIDHVAGDVAAGLKPCHSAMRDPAAALAVANSLALFPFTHSNSARLLIDGDATFDAIFRAIDSAEKYILVQFFIIRDDSLGRQLADRLIARAKQGVTVYFLFDEIGSIRLPARYGQKLRDAGVHVTGFRTTRGWRNRFQLNFRNHRKIVVADGAVAFIGGHNVGLEYLGKSPRFGHWRDTHVEIRGPAVQAIQFSFLQDWHWATGDLPDLLWKPAAAPDSNSHIITVPTGPADSFETCTLLFLAAISSARRRCWITSPYFVPDETVYDALKLAALRGVDVRIMLPAKPDHILVYLSAFSYLASAEAVGVRFYRYEAGFLHQKVMLIDDHAAAVGTANLDNRSFRLNFEITTLVADENFARSVAAMLEQDFSLCTRATPGDLERRNIFFQLSVRIARLLSPIQ